MACDAILGAAHGIEELELRVDLTRGIGKGASEAYHRRPTDSFGDAVVNAKVFHLEPW